MGVLEKAKEISAELKEEGYGPVLTKAEVAEILGCSDDTIERRLGDYRCRDDYARFTRLDIGRFLAGE